MRLELFGRVTFVDRMRVICPVASHGGTLNTTVCESFNNYVIQRVLSEVIRASGSKTMFNNGQKPELRIEIHMWPPQY